MKKTFIWFVIFVIVGFLVWFGLSSDREVGSVCTMEAKLCPDGSYVGRAGPNCEFTPCP